MIEVGSSDMVYVIHLAGRLHDFISTCSREQLLDMGEYVFGINDKGVKTVFDLLHQHLKIINM